MKNSEGSPVAAGLPSRSLSRLLDDLLTDMVEDDVPLGRVVQALHERGFGVLVFFMAFPMALPLPKPPGITALLGLPLLLLNAQIALGRDSVWLPERLARRTVRRERLAKLLAALRPYLQRMEKILHPRMSGLTRGLAARLSGLAGVVISTAIFLPFPGFNTVPALGLCLMGLGDVTRDGLAVVVGAAIGLAWIVGLSVIFAFVGVEGFLLAKDWLLSLL